MAVRQGWHDHGCFHTAHSGRLNFTSVAACHGPSTPVGRKGGLLQGLGGW